MNAPVTLQVSELRKATDDAENRYMAAETAALARFDRIAPNAVTRAIVVTAAFGDDASTLRADLDMAGREVTLPTARVDVAIRALTWCRRFCQAVATQAELEFVLETDGATLSALREANQAVFSAHITALPHDRHSHRLCETILSHFLCSSSETFATGRALAEELDGARRAVRVLTRALRFARALRTATVCHTQMMAAHAVLDGAL